MNPVRYIFLNKGLNMSPGKCAAQAAHAEMLALHDFWSYDPEKNGSTPQHDLYEEWIGSGHYTKLVMEAEDEQNLYSIQQYLKARGYRVYEVIDEGRTEIRPHTFTALAVELVDKENERVQQHFASFRTYKDRSKQPKKKKGLLR